jgi:hypothetical protein
VIPPQGTRQIRVILYAKETVVPYLDVAQESARRGSAYAKAAGNLAWSGRALRSACSCLNLILACIVYWQAWEISWVLSQCAPYFRSYLSEIEILRKS